ncbi:MAG: hypothetical protein ACTHZI_07685 [Luteimonas sp.]
MLISPPFLPLRGSGDSEEAYLAAAMSGDAPGHGAFPVSHSFGWHGGIHLTAPVGTNGARLPVRAIADGDVVYVRQPTPMPTDPKKKQAHPLGYNGWTDNGCVVIRHQTEFGSGKNANVTFYSIYMHLREIQQGVQINQPIYRKVEIGRAGWIDNEEHRLHFEIICDDTNLERLVGRSNGDLPSGQDGRTDAIYGDSYFHLPIATVIYPDRPPSDATMIPTPTIPGIHVTTESLFVSIRYETGAAHVTTYRDDGSSLGNPLLEPEAEYTLYRDAGRIVEAHRNTRATEVPSHSATYELLRFGRILGEDAISPPNTPHWRRIQHPGGEGWVNLNTPEIRKFSDADFPQWRGWKLIDDDLSTDSRSESPSLINLILGDAPILNAPDILAPANNLPHNVRRDAALSRLEHPEVQARLTRTICKFPSEWERETITARWKWLTKVGPPARLPPLQRTYLTTEDFQDFELHARALAFWEDANLGIDSNHWHFHPREFIRQARRCGWLSENEFAQCLPREFIAEHHGTRTLYRSSINYATSLARTRRIRNELNKMLRKHGIDSNHRASMFIANAITESSYLNQYYEYGRGGGHRYGDWHGRGIIQLTHEENYIHYFEYLGRDVSNKNQNIKWRDSIEDVDNHPYDVVESAGYWWSRNNANRTCDNVQKNVAWPVQVCENFDWSAKRCAGKISSETRLSNPTLDLVGRHINTGSPTTTIRMNGLPERRDVYTNVQAILTDTLYDRGSTPHETTLAFPHFMTRQAS